MEEEEEESEEEGFDAKDGDGANDSIDDGVYLAKR
jgi:hypothetical protein